MKPQNSLEPLTTTALIPSDMRGEARDPFLLTRDPFPVRQVPVGMLVLLGFITILGLWFGLAPINSAVISPGIVQVASHRKTIQHFEGGIVDEILVRNGDIVTLDQPLVKLKSIYPAAEMAQLEAQQLELLAVVGRLMAVQNGATEITLPPELAARADEPAVQSILAGQQQILDSFLHLQKERLSVFEQNIQQASEEINGRRVQIEARELQRELLEEELSLLKKLFDQDLMSRTRVLETSKELAEVQGDIGEYQAEIARINKNVLETRLQINEMHAAQMHQVTQQLREERAKLFDVTQRLTASRDVLSRTTIVSPVDGEVVNLQIYTTNGVITPGQPIMDIMPHDDELVVQALIDPNDIDEVRVGMPADISLTSLTRRNRVPIEGVVAVVSPDRLVDEQSGRPYYEARIEVAPTAEHAEGNVLMAGMGADVFIRTGERTALQYLMEPLVRNFRLGFREK
jgi:HlyD family type I secretion membrane fusion protein